MKLFLQVTAIALVIAATASASQRQGSLELHKVHHVLDENGQVWLTVQFVNQGNHPVTVAGIAPSRWGPWTKIGQKIDPGSVVRGKIKTSDKDPKNIWVDSSEGLSVFALSADGAAD